MIYILRTGWILEVLQKLRDCVAKVTMLYQVVFDAGPRQCGVSDHDGPAGGDGVRHRGLEAAAV